MLTASAAGFAACDLARFFWTRLLEMTASSSVSCWSMACSLLLASTLLSQTAEALLRQEWRILDENEKDGIDLPIGTNNRSAAGRSAQDQPSLSETMLPSCVVGSWFRRYCVKILLVTRLTEGEQLGQCVANTRGFCEDVTHELVGWLRTGPENRGKGYSFQTFRDVWNAVMRKSHPKEKSM
jgi:hypothetical protein